MKLEFGNERHIKAAEEGDMASIGLHPFGFEIKRGSMCVQCAFSKQGHLKTLSWECMRFGEPKKIKNEWPACKFFKDHNDK